VNSLFLLLAMSTANVIVCSLAYIVGLLLTGLPWKIFGLPAGAIAIPLFSVLLTITRTPIKSKTWLIAGLCGFLAILYFQIRSPQPSSTDISRFIKNTSDTQQVTVIGTIDSPPRINRSQRVQFELEVNSVTDSAASKKKASGTLYVTVPRSQDSQLYPGRIVSITGALYKPKAASNPGGFNFQQYLLQQGIFAGLSGQEINFPTPGGSPTFLWSLQQRIIHSQALWIDSHVGHLISAMVMGRNGVDLDYELQDRFARVGLAHALAASGTQVSLLAGIVLMLTRRLDRWIRLGIGLGTLLMYVGLTGVEPSVVRAAIMGVAVFFAVTIDRQVKPLSLLLMVATVMLLWQPIWIWSLAFQLSFLATLGLVVTVAKITTWLDWLPPRIAPLIAVPIAAYIWTLPLQLYAFGVVSPYCILINIFTSLLITIISIGGMASALLALIHPLLGSASAWLVQFPAIAFLKVAELGDSLPGNAFAIGTISSLQVLLLYGIYLLIWQQPQVKKKWWIAGIIGLGIVALPAAYTAANLSQVTLLSTSRDSVMVLRDRGKTGLINTGNETDVRFTVLPFLKQQGINHIDWTIDPDLQTSDTFHWKQMLGSLPIRMFYSVAAPTKTIEAFTAAYQALQQAITERQGIALQLSSHQKIQSGIITAQLISNYPRILQIQVQQQTWLLLAKAEVSDRTIQRLPRADVLWWSGNSVNPALIEKVQPQVAIASARDLSPKTQAWFKAHPAITFYKTAEEGAIQWTPKGGFKATIEARL
jgi:competence protein ComEC